MFNDFINDYRIGMNDIQIDGILDKEGITEYGAYKQASLEVFSRIENLIHSNKKIKELCELVEATKHEEDIFSLIKEKKNVQRIERELLRFYKYIIYFKSKIGKLTEEKILQYDNEFYIEKGKRLIIKDYFLYNKISPQTYEYIMWLPKKINNEMFEFVKENNNIESYKRMYLEKKSVIPSNDLLPEIDSIDFKNYIEYHTKDF